MLGIVAALGHGWLGPRLARRVEPLPPLPAVNRAGAAKVSASSFRGLRVSEVQGRGPAMLYLPQIQAQCKPAYAADGSPLTQWATDEPAPQYLQYDFAHRLQKRVPLAGFVIRWGKDYARAWAIQVSDDGRDWRTLIEENAGRGGVERYELSEPVWARWVRLECRRSAGKGFTVIDFAVSGPAGQEAPGRGSGLLAEASGPGQVFLKWSAERSADLFRFRLYRSTQPGFTPGPENLIAVVDGEVHLDLGLDPGTTYFYRVQAENFSGIVSEPSPEVKVTTPTGESFHRVQWRGVIEGFYNDPWPHQERLKLLAFLEDAGFNAYIYAPKVEPYHRQLWREPYPADEMKNFAELLAAAKAHRISFNYAISPGLDMDYTDPQEIETLKRKLKPFLELGVRAFTIALDDLPNSQQADGRMAERQVAMVNAVFRWLKETDPAAVLFFCPTVYRQSYETQLEQKPRFAEYTRGLAALDPQIPIFWTGHNVFSETIDLASAQRLAGVYGRPILIWDNYPVNDGGLRRRLFLGPYTGRDPNLGRAASGIFLNPMYLPNANYIPLYTAGRYFTDPDYEPWSAYEAALSFVAGEEGARALKPLADALLNHPLYPNRGVAQLPLAQAIADFWRAEGHGEARENLRRLFESYAQTPEQLAATVDNFELVQELMPAAKKLALYGRAGLLCLDFLAASEPAAKKSLRRGIQRLHREWRQNPWQVAEDKIPPVYRWILGAKPKGAVMEEFITRVLHSR